MTHIITAFFDDRASAQEAVDELATAGIPRGQIRLTPDNDVEASATATRSSYDYERDDKGFWASLADFFMPDDDRYTAAEAMNRGGIMVSATVEEDMAAQAEDILDRHGSVNLDERSESWRRDGWSGYADRGAPARGRANEESIPIVEEELRVGKRQVGGGRVKVRSYTVDTPISEDVTLREESVSVERRAVDRPVGGEDLFRDRTIEAEAHSEEAVVEKTARVKEEVVLKKHAGERTETVTDSVRRTEVEVEDDRGTRQPRERVAGRR